MNILLDTHILLWWLDKSPRLSEAVIKKIKEANLVYVSAATSWEIAIKVALGKLSIPSNLREALIINNFPELTINHHHAELAGSLPSHHYDPFDRMLIAQAKLESLVILTHDKHFTKYDCTVMLV